MIFQKSDISFAILSSYSLDIAWIYQFFDPAVPVIMVAQPGATGEASVKNVLPNWIKTTPFLPGGRGCMHMKVRHLIDYCILIEITERFSLTIVYASEIIRLIVHVLDI